MTGDIFTGEFTVEISPGSVPGPKGEQGERGPRGPGVVVIAADEVVPPPDTPPDTLVFRKRPE